MLQGHCTLRGNAFAQIVSNSRGEVTDLLPLHPDRVTIELLSDTQWRYRYTRRDGSEIVLARSEVFHLRGLSPDGIVGYNPITAAREAVAGGLAAQDYGWLDRDAKCVPVRREAP
jgi:phage portal protein BeeE